jgi:NADH-quinone oxidoreductase subunit C
MNWRVSDDDLRALGARVSDVCGEAVTGFEVAHGELTVTAKASDIVETLRRLRDDLQFQQLMDVCGADYPQRERRFDVVYHLLSLTQNRRVRVKVEIDEDTAVPSVTPVFPVADWFEREAFDMYGVFFSGHPDLRRLLTDYGFHGHPLRKDFPMTGYVEVRYDDELRRVVYEPVKSVEFRAWDFLSPWEGAEYAKPGQGYPLELPGEPKPEPGA